MWLFLAALVGLWLLCRWYLERQKVENLTEKYVFITGCDSGFGNQLARQLDVRGLRVLASCLTPEGAEQLEKVTSDRLKTTLLDVTNTENVAASTERELSPFGLRTSITEPGGFATHILDNPEQYLQSVFSLMPPDVKESYGQPYLDVCE
ncbi:17-beta-hydroxysteroid dehydrogenase type 6, partial [Ophiophagus hannah]